MALIPLKDEVTVTHAGVLDEWGQPSGYVFLNQVQVTPTSRIYKCRIDEGTRLTRDQQGNEVVSTTRILLDKSVAISYDDEFTFVDAIGIQRTKRPLRIAIIKDISSKPLFTEVEL